MVLVSLLRQQKMRTLFALSVDLSGGQKVVGVLREASDCKVTKAWEEADASNQKRWDSAHEP